MNSHTTAAKRNQATNQEAGDVHAWRAGQLTRLGLARPAAEAAADSVDWHEVAKLVQRGCPAALAVTIVQ
jgi:hypothetical protein